MFQFRKLRRRILEHELKAYSQGWDDCMDYIKSLPLRMAGHQLPPTEELIKALEENLKKRGV